MDVALLATNTCTDADRERWSARTFATPYALYGMPRPVGTWSWPVLARFAGVRNFVRYTPRVAAMRNFGSRAEVLRNALIYRRFLGEVRPDVIHVQHPLERCTY